VRDRTDGIFGSLAMFAAIRCASSLVSSFARRPGSSSAVVITMKQASLCSSIVHGGGKRRAALDHPLPTGRVVDEMSMVVTRQERHFEPSMRRVLGAHKKPKAESADCESPGAPAQRPWKQSDCQNWPATDGAYSFKLSIPIPAWFGHSDELTRLIGTVSDGYWRVGGARGTAGPFSCSS
jgi:hypothetical protein